MSHGLEIKNIGGSIIIDATYRHAHLIQSGSAAAAFTANAPGTVNFSATINTPILFVRAPLNATFCVISVNESSFLYYCSAGLLEWRVYGVSTSMPSPNGYGMAVYDGAGNIIFDSNTAVPLVSQTLTALVAGDIFEGYLGQKGFTAMGNTLIKTLGFSAAGADGGHPFVSASTFAYAQQWSGATMNSTLAAAGRFISATQLEIRLLQCTGGGNPNYPCDAFRVGSFPRPLLMIK